MNILDEIVARKRMEVEVNKSKTPVKLLENSKLFSRNTYSLKDAVSDKTKNGIIAEIKRKSPSKGIINSNVDVVKIAKGYVDAGASAISVLTDEHYFGGSSNDLTEARMAVDVPLLRKDFIVDEYQIVEAKSIGADAILLIAASLTNNELNTLSNFAISLGLQILLEVHNEEELNIVKDVPCHLIGVNNRNLKTFEVSLDVSRKLISLMPSNVVAISESGIENRETIHELKSLGYSGFLIGQYFMQTASPERACKDFIQSLK